LKIKKVGVFTTIAENDFLKCSQALKYYRRSVMFRSCLLSDSPSCEISFLMIRLPLNWQNILEDDFGCIMFQGV